MIDISKQYTYNGKQVRIYADGSDTVLGYIHCAILCDIGWEHRTVTESELVEVWQPQEDEIVYLWDNFSDYFVVGKYAKTKYGHAFRLSNGDTGKSYHNCAPFTGTLPEAFKGLL